MAEAHPSTETEQATAVETEGESQSLLSHNVPPPQNMDCSKLDWLLQINEDYFEDQLKTVVSNAHFQLRSYPFFYSTASTYTVNKE